MNIAVILVLIYLQYCTAANETTTETSSVTTAKLLPVIPYVVGGINARAREFPAMARLGRHDASNNETVWFCGGTLISELYVLTAAHCFYTELGQVNRVRLGELDFSSTTDDAQPEDYDVRRNVPHPGFDWQADTSTYNDIGLIELNRVVIFSPFKLPTCLPPITGDELDEVTAIGWGSTFYGSRASPHLQKVKLQPFTTERCDRYARDAGVLQLGVNGTSQYCAGSEFARDTCGGDSGGPLLTNHTDLTCLYVIVGVTSLGISSCGVPGIPAIYTRVFHYVDWIQNVVLG